MCLSIACWKCIGWLFNVIGSCSSVCLKFQRRSWTWILSIAETIKTMGTLDKVCTVNGLEPLGARNEMSQFRSGMLTHGRLGPNATMFNGDAFGKEIGSVH